MVGCIEDAKRFQDLLDLESHNMPYFFDHVFNDEGWRARSLSKKKFKLLKKIDPEIRKLLKADEKVYFLSLGVEESLVDSLFLGWLLYYINRVAFVFTTHRILLIQTRQNRPLELRYQIRYPAITKVSRTSFGNCQVKYRNGKTSVFSHMPKRDRKYLQEIVEKFREAGPTAQPDALGKENLCPRCFTKVDGYPAVCPFCQRPFKSANRAGILSLIFPGFGDFYLGHRGIAVLEVLTAAFVWFAVYLPREGEEPHDLLGILRVGLTIFLIMHGVDALVTRHVGRKGLYPAG